MTEKETAIVGITQAIILILGCVSLIVLMNCKGKIVDIVLSLLLILGLIGISIIFPILWKRETLRENVRKIIDKKYSNTDKILSNLIQMSHETGVSVEELMNEPELYEEWLEKKGSTKHVCSYRTS